MKTSDLDNHISEHLDLYSNEKFEWGSNDCCVFTLSFVKRVTGKDVYTKLLNSYSDEKSCKAMIQAYMPWLPAETDLVQSIFSHLMSNGGFEEIEPGYLKKGDVCLLKNYGRTVAAICLGNKLAARHPISGLVYLSTSEAFKGWRVK